jgi:thymidine kinase
MGKLYFYYGSMAAGKSLKLLSMEYQFKSAGNITYIMSTIDDKVESRCGLCKDAIKISKNMNIYNYFLQNERTNINKKHKIIYIFIDEAQFLNKKQIWQLSDIVDMYNVNVVCFGIKSDFICNGFEGSNELLLIADKIIECKSSCECSKKAIMNIRFINNKPIFNGEKIVINNNNNNNNIITYKSYCRKCYKILRNKYK